MGADTDPQSIIAIAVVLPVLDIIVVALRFYVRRVQRTAAALDDWLTIPATIMTIGLGVCLVLGVHHKAFGYPTLTTSEGGSALATAHDARTWNAKLQRAFQLMQVSSLGLVKIDVLLFYRRIFCSKSSTTLFNIVSQLWIVVVLMWTVAFFFAIMFSCGLRTLALWINNETLFQYCFGTIVLEEGFVASDFGTDIVTLLMPLPMIWTLHMNTNRKIAVTGVFLLGAVAVVASIVRMVIYVEAANQIYHHFGAVDTHLVVTKTLYWSMFESGLALIACCLPSLNKLLGDWSLQSLQRSLRRMLSLQSLHPEGNQPVDGGDGQYERMNVSQASHTPFAQRADSKPAVETYIMKDIRPESTQPPSGRIHVQSTISRSDAATARDRMETLA